MAEHESEIARWACKMAEWLANSDPGDRAAARRMDNDGAPIFWRFVADKAIGTRQEVKWLRIMRLLALLTPASATKTVHEPGRYFGAVLADGGAAGARIERPVISEARLARLLASRGDARLDALERAVRSVARQRPTIDVPSLAWAVTKDDGRAIARAYYTRLARQTETAMEKSTDE
ncbi:type I-E CRISPR-associated protein Cse2/CasB [Roseivivax sediminis]|uniref:CRISPR-associated protein Cse2 (CRISPR_cse2) n=1 Tax=Roseivivax sediminis TaxID=936889 RepID=A0A1I2EGA3_9RHOB|nr:type I-E CRISPR-associated protein Cse2/CasB [Roseivivax sediminis]SFE91677.1 CRISPR-associated protein Cse2 (CRISPR_cse2) [Roseivivax sediminis]